MFYPVSSQEGKLYCPSNLKLAAEDVKEDGGKYFLTGIEITVRQ